VSDDQVELVLDSKCVLGEGPVWDESNDTLVWVDILGDRVHRLDPRTGDQEALDVGQPVGAVALRERGGFVLALRDGFALVDEGSSAVNVVVPVEADDATTRMNDGKCDRRGRFWAGTMDLDESNGSGTLYRLSPDLRATPVVNGITVSNGLTWSADDTTLFFIDSVTRRVDAFDFDLAAGTIDNRRPVVKISDGAGFPDGMTIDADGYLWVALWGGSAVHRYSPDGELDRVVPVPTPHVTSCTFGGPDFDELYVTTARRDIDAATLASNPIAGGVFRVRPGVQGAPLFRFSG